MSELKELLRKRTIDYYKSECEGNPKYFDLYDALYEIFRRGIQGWPTVDNDGYKEKQDLENRELLELDDNLVSIACGGDWQEPMIITMSAAGDELVVVNCKDGWDEGDYTTSKFLSQINLDLTKL